MNKISVYSDDGGKYSYFLDDDRNFYEINWVVRNTDLNSRTSELMLVQQETLIDIDEENPTKINDEPTSQIRNGDPVWKEIQPQLKEIRDMSDEEWIIFKLAGFEKRKRK